MILTGHQHLVFPGGKEFDNIAGVDVQKGTLHGKPAVMAGFWGSHLGLVDLDARRRRARPGRSRTSSVEARPIYDRVDRKVVPKVGSEAARRSRRAGRP